MASEVFYSLNKRKTGSVFSTFDATVIKKSGGESSLSMFDFDFVLNALQQGYEAMYM